jgi:hypothetical protein
LNSIAVNLLCALIPSIVSGIGLYAISHSMNNHQEKLKKQEADHIKSEDHILNTLIATAEGTEAIAKAVQRIPDAHCNGDMKAAIEKVEKSLSSQRDFLREKAIEVTAK